MAVAKLSRFAARPILPYSPFFSRFRMKILLATFPRHSDYVKTRKHNDRSVRWGSCVHSTGTNTNQMSRTVNTSLYLTRRSTKGGLSSSSSSFLFFLPFFNDTLPFTGKFLFSIPRIRHYGSCYSCEPMPHICRHPRHARYIYGSGGHASPAGDSAGYERANQSPPAIRPFHRPRPLSPPGWFAANV